MNKHITTLSVLTLLPLTGMCGNQTQNKQKPNIIFLLMDDLGYGELGCFGQQKIETPNIDALAGQGKILTQHYSGSPVSAPSRCVLLTGMNTGKSVVRGNDEYTERGNVWSHQAVHDNPALEGQQSMPSNTITLAHKLKEAGYTTACIGKWGLGYPGSESEPLNMGFDFFFGYNCQRQAHTYYPTHLYKNKERVYLNNKVVGPHVKWDKNLDPNDSENYKIYSQNEYAPDVMFKETLNFIDENKNNPFFLWWTTPLPHVSLQAPKYLVDYYREKFGEEKPHIKDNDYLPCQYPRATYAAMVTYIDNQIGEIVKKLKEEGIYENTMIVFTSDNGPTFAGGTDSPWFDSAKPFKSDQGWGKCSLREGGIRVPTIVTWIKGGIEQGSSSDYISGFQDWMNTFCKIAGIKPSENSGINILPVLQGLKNPKRGHLYWEYPEGEGMVAVRHGDWKLLVLNAKKEPKYMLYNITTDPTETIDLFSKEKKISDKLIDIIREEHIKPENKSFNIPQFFNNL